MSSLVQPVRYKDMDHLKRVAECFPSGKILPKRLVTHKSGRAVASTFDIYKLTVKHKDGTLHTVLIFENQNFKWHQMGRVLVQIRSNYNWNATQFICSSGNKDDSETIIRLLNNFQGLEG